MVSQMKMTIGCIAALGLAASASGQWTQRDVFAPDRVLDSMRLGAYDGAMWHGTLVAPVPGAFTGQSGGAYIYESRGGNWIQTAFIPEPSAQGFKSGGTALGPDLLFIGSYVYENSGDGWNLAQTLVDINNGTLLRAQSMAFEDETLVAGIPESDGAVADSGAVFVFANTSGEWAVSQVLTAPDGQRDDAFGYCVDLLGDVLIVGAIQSNFLSGNIVGSGKAYVYVQRNGQWELSQTLLPNNPVNGKMFGFDVGQTTDSILIGAPGDTSQGSLTGAVYVFNHDGQSWTQTDRLLASDGWRFDWFGSSIEVENNTALIASPRDSYGGMSDAGTVFIFGRVADDWIETGRIHPQGATDGDRFGNGLVLSHGVAAIGAPFIRHDNSTHGAIYTFDGPEACHADFNFDGDVNTLDFLAFLNAFSSGDLRADFDGGGTVDTLDFLAFLNAFNAGC